SSPARSPRSSRCLPASRRLKPWGYPRAPVCHSEPAAKNLALQNKDPAGDHLERMPAAQPRVGGAAVELTLARGTGAQYPDRGGVPPNSFSPLGEAAGPG